MGQYNVQVLMEWPQSGRRFPMVKRVAASSAQDAITVACEAFKADGWPGPFRFAEAENVADGHDVWKSSW